MMNGSLSTSNSYAVAAYGLSKHLSPERAIACFDNLKAIDHLENHAVIGVLDSLGELTEQDKQLVQAMAKYEVSAANMTIPEAQKVYEYVIGSTSEIVEEKVIKIVELLTMVQNGATQRRDYQLWPDKAEALRLLIEKGVMYDRGEYNMSRSFDVDVYLRRRAPADKYIEDTETSLEYESARELIPRNEFRNLLEIYSDDELIDGGYVTEDDLFEYGPYTRSDMRIIAMFAKQTWARVTNSRTVPRLQSLLDEMFTLVNISVESDINRRYISDLILPARRPSAKHMIETVAGFGLECMAEVLEEKPENPTVEEAITHLKAALHWCAYYTAMTVGMTKEYLKNKYNAARPINSKFYEELLEITDGWSEKKAAKVDADFNQVFVKLDEYLFNAQAAYVDVLAALGKASTVNIDQALALITHGTD